VLCFAYGSNMDWTQMKERCASTRFAGVALLPDHRLAFTRKSVKRGCGVADAVPGVGRELWGVVYEVSDSDVGKLDACEGYSPGRAKNAYWRRECRVLLDGDDRRPLTASAYFGDAQPSPPLPNQAYKDLILSGARHWHLPNRYIEDLERIEVGE
jgi:gamma-glutamylcyclotransferase